MIRAGAKRKLVYSDSPMKSVQTPPPRKVQRGCHSSVVSESTKVHLLHELKVTPCRGRGRVITIYVINIPAIAENKGVYGNNIVCLEQTSSLFVSVLGLMEDNLDCISNESVKTVGECDSYKAIQDLLQSSGLSTLLQKEIIVD